MQPRLPVPDGQPSGIPVGVEDAPSAAEWVALGVLAVGSLAIAALLLWATWKMWRTSEQRMSDAERRLSRRLAAGFLAVAAVVSLVVLGQPFSGNTLAVLVVICAVPVVVTLLLRVGDVLARLWRLRQRP